VQAADPGDSSIQKYLLANVPEWMAANHVPCVGIGIIKEGKISWVKVFGELQQGHPAPQNTLFNIASQTKPVTAMLTLRLMQLGLWKLDEPLSAYWIDPDLTGDPNLPKLTTRMVLSHQTGFPNWRSENSDGKLHFNVPPGTRFGYSGEGFEYLRRALEKKFHQSLDILATTYLFKPLKMKDTRYWGNDLDTNRFAKWHDGKGQRYNVSMQTSVNAADDLITTIQDYCTFGIYSMEQGGTKDSLYVQMITPQVKFKEDYYRGLGWGLVKGLPSNDYALEHGGSDIGVRTMAIFLPVSKSGIVVMTNGDNGLFLIDQVIRSVLPEGNTILTIMNKGASAHTRIQISQTLIQSYAGQYEQPNGKILLIQPAEDGLKVSGDGAPTATLYPESNNKFFLEGYDVQMEFPDTNTLIIYESGRQVMKIKRKS
jgi:CubicO group peptidase (beta-lactamase class C family)